MIYYQTLYGEYFEDEEAQTNKKKGKKTAGRSTPLHRLPCVPVPPQKHYRTSLPVDVIDPVYYHLDPISVSLQERVKVGGHITSVTKKPYHKVPFYYILSEVNPVDHVTKRAVLSHEIEFEESRDRIKISQQQKISRQDWKAVHRDYHEAVQNEDQIRLHAEKERRQRDIQTKHEKYFDPEAFMILDRFGPHTA